VGSYVLEFSINILKIFQFSLNNVILPFLGDIVFNNLPLKGSINKVLENTSTLYPWPRFDGVIIENPKHFLNIWGDSSKYEKPLECRKPNFYGKRVSRFFDAKLPENFVINSKVKWINEGKESIEIHQWSCKRASIYTLEIQFFSTICFSTSAMMIILNASKYEIQSWKPRWLAVV